MHAIVARIKKQKSATEAPTTAEMMLIEDGLVCGPWIITALVADSVEGVVCTGRSPRDISRRGAAHGV
ncbi:hypothetical protein TRAPUB_8678 [Trametes pubescens]|uniref:Uncharacterized protein n=1 Tax=Trametes pubescens TaxID=154538 RepID=A0A1M2W4H9_TRAPU|nr:hypothetical protein TRAPUB_8678 [Trametes pubescens]